ncbi:hypothetical protein CAP35_04095 [Chitinophagaceae bacterium IBVUCB1]|nr:hypothetical protein CAP35_04095 [Chitinophagaceae bacterium IBVUCB1]
MITEASGQVGGGLGSYLRRQYLQMIFLYLEEKYLKPDQYLQINFGNYSKFYCNDTINGKLPYSLGYGNVVFNIYSSDGNRINKQKAFKTIILNVSTDSINARDCLKLLLYGLEHQKDIEALQRDVFVQHVFGGSDSIKTVPQKNIDDILKTDNPFLNELLKHKVYRQSFPVYPESFGKLDIYIQNDSFYLYETENIKPTYYNLRNYLKKDIKTDTLNTSLFSFSEMTDFVSDKQDNFLLFDNSGRFYHIILHSKKISGPHSLPMLGNEIDKYSKIVDSFTKNGDSIILRIETDYNDGGYNIVFDTKTKKIEVDSTSFGLSIKSILKEIKEENNRAILIREQESLAKRKYHILILAFTVIALNLFLALSKRL